MFVDFAIAVIGGVAVGVVVAWVIVRVRRRLKAPVLDTSISLAAPYVAYIPAALFHGSGFLAVVITGIWLGYRAPSFQSAESRVAERINWRTRLVPARERRLPAHRPAAEGHRRAAARRTSASCRAR